MIAGCMVLQPLGKHHILMTMPHSAVGAVVSF